VSDTTTCRVCAEPVCNHCGVCGAEGSHREGYGFAVCDRHAVPVEGLAPSTQEGAVGWAFRPPQARLDDHHDQPIVLGGKVFWQQRTPVHARGSRYKSASVRTVRRERSEQDAARLNTLLDACTPEQRAVLVLQARGRSYEEIAAELGIGLSTVRERARRGRERIRKGQAQ